VRARVDEDAERRVAEPVGQSLREGIPGRGVAHGGGALLRVGRAGLVRVSSLLSPPAAPGTRSSRRGGPSRARCRGGRAAVRRSRAAPAGPPPLWPRRPAPCP